MEKKTIGQFIAALRKANGMTQQDVADRLNVSNKAISRWERDECAPDITLIPALAEMFGVTCDELLKGERITYTANTEKSEPKVEKQLKALINRTISGFKTLIWISFAVSMVGLVCMFGIAYGFYRPVIGFTVMLLFEACAFAIATLAVSRTKDIKTDNELFEHADDILIKRYDNCLGEYSFHAFFLIISVILLSLPLVVCASSYYIDSVLTFESYLPFLVGITLVLAFVCLKAKEPYCKWIAGANESQQVIGKERITEDAQLPEKEQIQLEGKMLQKKRLRMMNWIQLGAVILAGMMFFITSYFEEFNKVSPICLALSIGGLILFLVNIFCFVVFGIKYKKDGKQLLLPGVRNMLLLPSAYLMAGVHGIYWTSDSEWGTHVRGEYWNIEYLYYAIGWALLVTVVFEVITKFLKKRNRD